MELRVCLAVLCAVAFLFFSVSAAGTSLTNTITGGSQDSGISIPQLPPPAEGSTLQRKALDSQPYIFKTSNRLLQEAEMSRDAANKKYEEMLVLMTQNVNKNTGKQYSIEFVRKMFVEGQRYGGTAGPDPVTVELYEDAMENYNLANKQYNAALAATDEKDFARKARIFESASSMYATIGDTAGQKQVEKAAIAARAQAAAESLPLPTWIAVCGLIGGLFLIQRKLR
jgi:hypothetical protein